jgi:hypothetical protein
MRSTRKTKSTRRSIRRSIRRSVRQKHKAIKKQRGGNQAMVDAAKVGDLATINQLLGTGALPNGQDPANPDALIGWHKNPLVWAAREGHLNVVQRLLEVGAEVNFQGDGHTVWFATQRGHLAILELLLQQPGVNVNMKASFGDFPLGTAVEHRNIPAIQLLLAAGADPDFRPPAYTQLGEHVEAESAREFAQRKRYDDIVQILEGQEVAPQIQTSLNVPAGSENTIYYEPIENGNELVDFHGESGFGRFYKRSTFEGPPRLTQNPATRAPIRPQNLTYHTARIFPAAQTQPHAP